MDLERTTMEATTSTARDAGDIAALRPNLQGPQRGTWRIPDRFRAMDARQFAAYCELRTAHVMESGDDRHLFTVPFERNGEDGPDDEYHVHSRGTCSIDDGVKRYESSERLYLRVHCSRDRTREESAAVERMCVDLGLPPLLCRRDVATRLSWFWSKAGALTNLHVDLNGAGILFQVLGRKEIVLASPTETGRLYPFPAGHVYERRSRVFDDVMAPSVRERFPELDRVAFDVQTIGPGEWCLIPKGWWHQVKSLDTPTLSVNLRMRRHGYECFSERSME